MFEKKFCPRQRSCLEQVVCSRTNLNFEENSSATGSAAALDKLLVQKKVGFLEKVPPLAGSAAAPDKWLGREKANNPCSQGRGAPFGGSAPRKAGGCGGAQPLRPPRPQIRAKIIVKLTIHRPGGRYVILC